MTMRESGSTICPIGFWINKGGPDMSDVQVKSRARVADHGEVFTAQREVNAMLDLVKLET